MTSRRRCRTCRSNSARPANPPRFDDQLTGTTAGDTREFTVDYPHDYEVQELAGATVDYSVTVKGVRRKEVPAAR